MPQVLLCTYSHLLGEESKLWGLACAAVLVPPSPFSLRFRSYNLLSRGGGWTVLDGCPGTYFAPHPGTNSSASSPRDFLLRSRLIKFIEYVV